MIELSKEPLETVKQTDLTWPLDTTKYIQEKLFDMFKERKVVFINLWKAYEEGYPKIYCYGPTNFPNDPWLQVLVFVGFDYEYDGSGIQYLLSNNVKVDSSRRNVGFTNPLFFEKVIPAIIDILYNHDEWTVHYDDSFTKKFHLDCKRKQCSLAYTTPFSMYVGGTTVNNGFNKDWEKEYSQMRHKCYQLVGGHLPYDEWKKQGWKFPNKGIFKKPKQGFLGKIKGFFKKLFH